MKNLFLAILILVSIHAQSQVSFAGKLNGSTITLDELLNEKELKLSNNTKDTIIGFSVTSNGCWGFEPAYSNQITERQKILFKSAESQSEIHFNNIRVKLSNDSIVSYPAYFLIKDGPYASLRKYECYHLNSANYLYDHPRIYCYPSYYSFDTTQYKIISFQIISKQPNYYYEFESNSNMLTPEMLNFIKTASTEFFINGIRAIDKNNKTLYLYSISISPWFPSKLKRTKNQLLSAKKIDLLAQSANLKTIRFSLYIPAKTSGYSTEEDEAEVVIEEEKSFDSKSDEITAEMKNFINNSKVGDVLHFRLDYYNSKGEEKAIQLDVDLTD